jgi:hypothetical protein
MKMDATPVRHLCHVITGRLRTNSRELWMKRS